MLLLAGVVLLFVSALAGSISEGVVEYKGISGTKGGSVHSILLNRPIDDEPWILVKDRSFEQFFTEDATNAVINESVEHALQMDYVDVTYIVAIRNDPEAAGVQPYTVDRNTFNGLAIGNTVSYLHTNEKGAPAVIRVLSVS